MKSVTLRTWITPLALLVICLTSFAALLPKIHFYWDDWTILYYIHFLGPESFKEAFAFDRPLMAGIYKTITSLLGERSINWQIYALMMRWLTGITFWWTFRLLWKDKTLLITAASFLFVIYPGFNQGFIAITYGNAFLFFSFFLLSIGLMIWAFRKAGWFWVLYPTSILLSGYCMFLVEYFFGLELLRPVILIIIFEQQQKNWQQSLKKAFQYWLPYLVFMILFLGWRIATPTPRAEIDIFQKLASNPLTTALHLGKTVLEDIIKVTFLAWRQIFDLETVRNFDHDVFVRYLLIIIITVVFALIFLNFIRLGEEKESNAKTRRWGLSLVLLGLFSTLIAGIPIWMTNLRIELFFPWDRFTLAMMPGVSLLLIGLLSFIFTNRKAQILIVSLLIGMAAGSHYQNALRFRTEWLMVRDFFWQLTWRAPDIEPGTTIMAPDLPFEFDWDNSLTSPLNWIYAPENQSKEFHFLLYNLEDKLSEGYENFTEDSPIIEQHRTKIFRGKTSQILSITFQPPACLKVLDPETDQQLPDKGRFFQEAIDFSRPELINLESENPKQPPLHLLGPEPEHDWCYFYEKADLARQKGDWDEIVRLAENGLDKQRKYYKTNVAELLPFIEGYARSGDWDEALVLSHQAYESWENMRFVLCDLWSKMEQEHELDGYGQRAYQEITRRMGCEIP